MLEYKNDRYIGYVIIIVSLAVFCYMQFLKLQYSPDDTYIYLQYAKNLATGHNFSFNPGEPSYGVTSPLWTIILTLPFIFGVDGFWFAKCLDLICIVFSFYIFLRIAYKLSGNNFLISSLVVSLFMINSWVVRSTFTGMETSFAVLILLLTFYFYYCKRYRIVCFLLGVAILIRPESFVLLFIFLSIITYKHYKQKDLTISLLIQYICLTLILVIPFWIFAYIAFGTIVSNTSTGKAVLTGDLNVMFNQAKFILQIFFLTAPIEVILGICGLGFLIVKKRDINYLPIVVWILGLLSLYIFTTTAVMARYLLVLYPFVLLLAVISIQYIKLSPKYISIALLSLSLLYYQYSFYKIVKPYCIGFTNGVHQCLIPIGLWLDNNTPIGSTILVNDVGAIGYYSERYVIDAAALINRDLELNKKILALPIIEKEYPHFMLNFIRADYLIEKDTAKIKPLESVYNIKLEPCASFEFQQMWVFNPNPQYFTIYRIIYK